MYENGLDCSEPIHLKFLACAWFVFAFWLFGFVWWHGFICILLFLAYGILAGIYTYPDMRIFADGIETERFGIKGFVDWKEIERVGYQIYGARVHYRKRPFLLKLLFPFYNIINISKWRNNYEEAMAYIEASVANASEE
jgi:hypothetical protein